MARERQRPAVRGFTMIELVVAVAVLAVLAGIAVPVTAHVLRSARVSATKKEMAGLGEALRAYGRDRGFSPSAARWGRFPPEHAGAGLYPTVLGTELENDADGTGWDPVLKKGWDGPYMSGASEAADGDADGTAETVRGYQVDAWGRYYIYRNRDPGGAFLAAPDGVRLVTLTSGGPDRDPATTDDNLEFTVYRGPAW